jgi:hypothetical protein
MSFCRGNELPVIKSFLASPAMCALVTSDDYYQGRSKVMEALEIMCVGATVLFRENRKDDIQNDFRPFHFSSDILYGKTYTIRGLNYQIDMAFDTHSWILTGDTFDYAILYPVNNILRMNRISVIKNLLSVKKIGKVFLITDSDNDTEQYQMLKGYANAHIHLAANESYYKPIHTDEELE